VASATDRSDIEIHLDTKLDIHSRSRLWLEIHSRLSLLFRQLRSREFEEFCRHFFDKRFFPTYLFPTAVSPTVGVRWNGPSDPIREPLPDRKFQGRIRPRRNAMLKNFVNKAVEFVKSEDGPTAVEYAVMLALIIVVCLAAIQILGTNANSAFNTVGQSIGKTVSS
jgi:pilus assembly protein Flp/PilA